MAEIDLSNVDTVKAFFSILLGAALAAVLIYIYDTSIAPQITKLESSAGLNKTVA